MNIFAVGGVEGNALCVCVSASIGVQSRERDSDLAKPAGIARLEKKSDTTESRYQARPDCNSFSSASAYSLAPRPMEAPDPSGKLVTRLGHAGCGEIPHALTNLTRPWSGMASDSSQRTADYLW